LWAKKLKNNLPQYNSQTVVRLIVSQQDFSFNETTGWKRERKRTQLSCFRSTQDPRVLFCFAQPLQKSNIKVLFFCCCCFYFSLYWGSAAVCLVSLLLNLERERGVISERECPCGRQICIRSDSIFSSFILFLSPASKSNAILSLFLACVFLCEHCMHVCMVYHSFMGRYITCHHVLVMLHVLLGFENDIGLVGIYRDCQLGLVPWWIPCECLDHFLLLCYWSFCHVCCGFVLLFLVTWSRDFKCGWNFMLINVCN